MARMVTTTNSQADDGTRGRSLNSDKPYKRIEPEPQAEVKPWYTTEAQILVCLSSFDIVQSIIILTQ